MKWPWQEQRTFDAQRIAALEVKLQWAQWRAEKFTAEYLARTREVQQLHRACRRYAQQLRDLKARQKEGP